MDANLKKIYSEGSMKGRKPLSMFSKLKRKLKSKFNKTPENLKIKPSK